MSSESDGDEGADTIELEEYSTNQDKRHYHNGRKKKSSRKKSRPTSTAVLGPNVPGTTIVPNGFFSRMMNNIRSFGGSGNNNNAMRYPPPTTSDDIEQQQTLLIATIPDGSATYKGIGIILFVFALLVIALFAVYSNW